MKKLINKKLYYEQEFIKDRFLVNAYVLGSM